MALITIGWTKGTHSYSPMLDGWRADAEQDTLFMNVPDEFGTDVTALGEAIFEATNAPYLSDKPLVHWLQMTLSKLPNGIPRSLSVGDTVTKSGLLTREVAEVVAMGFVVHNFDDFASK